MNTQLLRLILQLTQILQSGERGGILPPGEARLYWVCRAYCELREAKSPGIAALAGYQIDIGACSNYPWEASTPKKKLKLR